jgi:enamine deaminase RidA (YjgF/YER057c/UK114 family)
MKRHNPKGVAGPFASYSHGIELDEPVRFLFGAGQVGVDAHGRIGEGIEEQASLVWQNIESVLGDADMRIDHVVQLTMLLLHREDYAAAREVRERALGEHRPASTLIYVNGLANPQWLIEIDYVAAAPR